MRSNFCHTCFIDLAPGELCPQCGEAGSPIVDPGDVLLPGSVLENKYKVGRLLGRGGFGATYLAWDLNLRVRIAIKEFLPRQLAARVSGETQVFPYTGNQGAFQIGLEQFLSEARTLARFRDHPAIISVLDFFPENGTGYMVMEYLDGSTLEQYATTVERVDVAVALRMLFPVTDALRACHAIGLIHRDVSPDNIFLTSDGRLKLLDFGAARFAIGAQSTNLSVILKEGYAPFEQYQRNGRQGPWTDIYALTATLYRLLTGELPVTAPDRLGGTPLPSPSARGAAVPPKLQALLDKGMAIQPEGRYQTIDEFQSDLKAALGDAPAPSVGPRNRRRAISLMAGAALTGGAILVALLHRNGMLEWTGPTVQGPTDSPPVPQSNASPPPTAAPSDATSPPTDGLGDGNPPPTGRSPVQIEAARGYILGAAQDQIQLARVIMRKSSTSSAIDKLSRLGSKNEAILRALETNKDLYNALEHQAGILAEKYMNQLRLLGGMDQDRVDAAMALEQDKGNIPSSSSEEAKDKALMNAALDLLVRHIDSYRHGQLTLGMINADVEVLNQ